LFQRLGELEDVVIKLDNPSNPNNFFNFKVISIEDHIEYFIFEVEIFKDFYLGEFLNEAIYSVYFDIKSATESDDLKLDKADYTGNATDIDNRIIVLENLQDLSTNFTGQAFAVWTGVGYVYDVICPDYYIQGVLYPGVTVQKTLEESDAVHSRFDVFYVNALGVQIKTGIPAENPLVPTIDTETELFITSQLVTALSTTPEDSTFTQVYDENVEWTATSNNSSAINFNATTTPYKGTKHGDIGAYALGQSAKFTNSVPLSVLNYTTLKFAINLKGNFGKTKKILVQLMNGSTIVSSAYYFDSGQNGFVHNIINTYQLIAIDFSSFTFTQTNFDTIAIDFGSANSFGFRLDDVVLVKGSTVVAPTQKAITSIVTDSGIANATVKDDTFQFKGANGLVVSAIGKIITFTSNFTTALKANYDTAYTWVLAHGNVDNTSDVNKPISTATQTALDLKVDKVTGKGLSTEDYTTAEKNKLASIDATHYLAPLQTTVQLSALPQASLSDKARVYVEDDTSDYFYDATASSGDIAPDDQTGGIGFWRKVAVGGETAASILTKYESNADRNAFTNALKAKLDSITEIFTTALKAAYDGAVANSHASGSDAETATTLGALIGAAGDATPNNSDFIATSLTAGGILKKITWTNAKAFLKIYFDTLYQAVLVSGTNIKTINGTSILGAGNIDVVGAATYIYPSSYTGTDTEKIQQAIDDGSLTETSVIIPKKDAINTPYDIQNALLLKSNTTIIIDGAVLKLTNTSRDNIFRTENCGLGLVSPYTVLSNIHILGINGATLEGANNPRATGDSGKTLVTTAIDDYTHSYGTDAGVSGQTQTGDWRNVMILFAYTTNYSIKGLRLNNAHGWAILSERCSIGRIENLHGQLYGERTIPGVGTRYVKNGDFVDVGFGCSNIIIKDITGHSDDDSVALFIVSSTDAQGVYGARFVTGGVYAGAQDDIHDIIIKDVSTSTREQNVRILNFLNTKIYNITVENITNTNTSATVGTVVNIGSTDYGTAADLGQTYNISINNVKNTYKNYCVQINGSLSESNISNLIDLSSANTEHPLYINPTGKGIRDVTTSNIFKKNYFIDIAGFAGNINKRSGLRINKTSKKLEIFDEIRVIDAEIVGKEKTSPTDVKLFWSGSQAQYNALTPSANTVYFIIG